MKKKTQEVPASELSMNPVMTNIDPVMTTQRAEKRLAKALESGPGENRDCSSMVTRFNRTSDKDEEGGLCE